MFDTFKQYIHKEGGSESTEKIILIGGAVILAMTCIAFYTYQVNKGAADGAKKAEDALIEAYNS